MGIQCYNTVVIDMKIINRKDYINKLLALKNKPDIKIITGVRRAGKSVLLNEFSKYILANTKHFDYDIAGIRIIDLSSCLLADKIN